jgi:hypothetical protein
MIKPSLSFHMLGVVAIGEGRSVANSGPTHRLVKIPKGIEVSISRSPANNSEPLSPLS